MGFLPFTLKASPTVFGLLWASFQDYPPTHWLPLPLLSTCLLHRYSFHDKIPFCLFLLYTSTSLPNSMACIRWSQPFKIPSQQDIFPKRSYGRKPNIDPIFPPPPNHALWIPLTMGPPPLYWLGTGWWCPALLCLLHCLLCLSATPFLP